MQLRALRHFLGRRWVLEFGKNQAKTVDKKAIFSTRERGSLTRLFSGRVRADKS